MLDALIEVVLAPALVAAATLAARRWGNGIGGLVSAFPAIVGPVLLVAALEHGEAFASRAANGTLLGLVTLAVFAVAYGIAARRAGWRTSLAAGWMAAGLTGLAVGAVAAGPPAGLIAAAASLALAHRALVALAARSVGCTPGHAQGAKPAPAHPPGAGAVAAAPGPAPPALDAARWDLLLRIVLTAALVVSLTWAAGRFGPVAGGVLAALPVLASVLAAFTHARDGGEAVTALLRGMLAGMGGFVVFCALVWLLVEPAGIAVAFVVAAVAAAATQFATARTGARQARATAATATA
jgi:hypothetical protein